MTYWTDRPPTWQPSDAEYYGSGLVGSTALKRFVEDRQEYHRDDPVEVTDAMLRGRAVDCALTEPDTFDARFYEDNGVAASAIKWGHVQRPGEGLSPPLWEQVESSVASAWFNAQARRFVNELPGLSQACHRWTHPSGIECRARWDRCIATDDGPGFVELKNWDWKGAPSGHVDEICRRRTHCQCALYSDGFMDLWRCVPHVIVVIVPPSGAWVRSVPMSRELLEVGRRDNDADLYAMAECRRTGDWSNPADNALEYAYPPGWVKRESEQRHGN